MAPVTLQVYSLVDVFLSEYVMASPHSFNKSQAQKKKSEPFEADIGICRPLKILSRNSSFRFIVIVNVYCPRVPVSLRGFLVSPGLPD